MSSILTTPLKDWIASVFRFETGTATGSYKAVQDGAGNTLALEVSTSGVKSTGDLDADGDANITGVVTAGSYQGDGSAMSGVAKSTRTIATKSADYTTTANDDIVFADTGGITINLLAAASYTNQIFVIKNLAGTSITVDPNASETIDDAATKTLNQFESIEIISDGSNWHILASN